MITLTADWHIWNHKRHGGALIRGINRRGQHCLDVAHKAVQAAQGPLIVAGDLIDDAGPIQPQLAHALKHVLLSNPEGVHMLLGNHDMTAKDDHSLGIYSYYCDETQQYVLPVDRITWRNASSCVFQDEYPCKGDILEACMVPFHCDIRDERVRNVPLVVAHFGVYDDSFPKWCRNDKKAWHVNNLFAFMKERNIKCVAIGDWHSRRIWFQMPDVPHHNSLEVGGDSDITSWPLDDGDMVIMQIGALVPTGFDNSGMHGYGTVAHWDGERLSWQELPGPRFCTAHTADEEVALIAEAAKLGHKLYLRRFYENERPSTPEGVEAYEALPITLEKAVLIAATKAGFPDPQAELNALMQDWLDQWENDRDALEAHIKRYV